MQALIEISLGICAVCGAVVLLLGVLFAAACMLDSLRSDNLDRQAKRDYCVAEESYRNRMLGDAYWFSEHMPTYQLLHDLATQKVDSARQNWRANMAKDNPEASRGS